MLYLRIFLFRSAGVGRTGVFITLSIVLERMQYEGVVDIFQSIRILRTQRPGMVQTEVIFISISVITSFIVILIVFSIVFFFTQKATFAVDELGKNFIPIIKNMYIFESSLQNLK